MRHQTNYRGRVPHYVKPRTEVIFWGCIKGLSVLLVCSIFFGAAVSLSSVPVVKESFKTGQCIEVQYFDKGAGYSCSNLPEKYTHMWVE